MNQKVFLTFGIPIIMCKLLLFEFFIKIILC